MNINLKKAHFFKVFGRIFPKENVLEKINTDVNTEIRSPKEYVFTEIILKIILKPGETKGNSGVEQLAVRIGIYRDNIEDNTEINSKWLGFASSTKIIHFEFK